MRKRDKRDQRRATTAGVSCHASCLRFHRDHHQSQHPQARPHQMTRIALALVLSSAAAAQTTTFRDPAGLVTGKASTNSEGTTTFYDPAGRVTGRARTNSEGTTTFYDAAGRVTGKATARRR